ncbi:UNVERIFIED_CONTAM: hypothetical protein FKN15_012392 [Acipenser sinensis]
MKSLSSMGQRTSEMAVKRVVVLFTDECRFALDRPVGRQRVWRLCGGRYADCFIVQANQWGGGSVMMWGGISFNTRTPLVLIEGSLTAQQYIDQVLKATQC